MQECEFNLLLINFTAITMTRRQQLEQWLTSQLGVVNICALDAGASFRKYFRVTVPCHTKGEESSYIAMDSPPDIEPALPFILQSDYFAQANIPVPKVIASDKQQGFLLLTDFGTRHLGDALNQQNGQALYRQALVELLKIHQLPPKPLGKVANLDLAFMKQEIDEFQTWFLEGMLKLALTDQQQNVLREMRDHLVETIGQQPRVFIHRDFHSQNIMVLDDSRSTQIGILDFQDAMRGPITYDVASLLRDCYLKLPNDLVLDLVSEYQVLAQEAGLLGSVDFVTFMKWFDYTGMQRHLKAILTFARKYLRDSDEHYLQYIPRTLMYIEEVCDRYQEFALFGEWLRKITREASDLCKQ